MTKELDMLNDTKARKTVGVENCTPGPWEVDPRTACAVHNPKLECWIPQNRADAYMLSASREMYEALLQCLDWIENDEEASIDFPDEWINLTDTCRSALGKARGEI